ncbi:MAG TPA: hypothetical protein VFF95_13140 [Candidatus Binatus sp.]|jgi:hypothetical protein|nr:hypothetical protein [Candidatus Binatus sp.]
MAGIDFDRQVFVPSADQAPPKQPSRIMGVVILAIAIAGIGFVGYKLLSDTSLNGTSAEANSLQQIQQQLADMKERVDQLEKRHRPAAPESAAVTPKTSPATSGATTRTKPAYQISAASSLNPQRSPSPITQPSPGRSVATAPASDADRESWQATTDRLGDVVGAVGSQEAEITQTRDELNQLLSQTRRSALQFELTRGTGRQSVGPVELLLKGSDPRSQRYTVCVYVNNKCIELKDRVLDEVVVFVLARGTPPLELVATKISRDEIVGYLEVPTDKAAR